MAKVQYAIMRFSKYKGPEIGRIEAHDERTKEKYASNPDVDASRSALNFHLIQPEHSYREEAERQIAEAGCRVRSDSVKLVEVLIGGTPSFALGLFSFFAGRWKFHDGRSSDCRYAQVLQGQDAGADQRIF